MRDLDPAKLDAARKGDRDALGEILVLVQPEIWRFVERSERDREAAEDLTQEALLRIARGLPRFRGESGLRTWVLAIARNVVRDHQRQQYRRPRRVATPLPQDFTALPGAEGAVEIGMLVDALPVSLREVFVLVEVSGLRYREVAEVIGVKEGTVKSRMFHARKLLVRALAEAARDD